MGDIVSLKLHRKRKARANREDEATEKRAKSGRAKDERELSETVKAKADKLLDGHKRDE